MVIKKHNFNWSQLTRETIYKHFYQLDSKLVDKELEAKVIYKIFKKQALKLAPLIVTKTNSMDVDHGYVYMGGCYSAEYDEQNQPAIELNLHFHPFDDYICYTKIKFRRSCMLIADILLHEIIHMRQHRRRDFTRRPDYKSSARSEKKKQEQCYLGNYDEIDAYSFNIACELYRHYKDDSTSIHQYLNSSNKNAKRSHTWKWYMRTFDYDHNHPVIKKLKTKVVKYLPHAALGKPYKNSDYIWY